MHMAVEVAATAVMVARGLVPIMILALVLVMVVQGGFMEVGQAIVAVVVTILMEGRFSLSFSCRRTYRCLCSRSFASSRLDFRTLKSTCCKRTESRRSEEPLVVSIILWIRQPNLDHQSSYMLLLSVLVRHLFCYGELLLVLLRNCSRYLLKQDFFFYI